MDKGKIKISYKVGIPLFILAVAAGLGYVYWNSQETMSEIIAPIVQAEPVWYSKLDGSKVAEDKQNPLVLGVMIDNHPDARLQQAGLSKARVVYEALAEGGITRYLALFNTQDALQKVGPVRSARPYYLSWIREYGDSTYWHSGGSPEALAMIKNLSLPSTNEFFNGQYYWRDRKYEAPHNLFTRQELWLELLNKRGAEPGMAWEGWMFSASSTTSTVVVKGVTIVYSPDYKVGWEYNGERYQRTINSRDHVDSNSGELVMADTIIIQEVKTKILDEVGRKELDTVGSGNVRILKRGTMVRGIWKKEAETKRTRFFDEAGQEIPLVGGQIWLQVVPINPNVEITS